MVEPPRHALAQFNQIDDTIRHFTRRDDFYAILADHAAFPASDWQDRQWEMERICPLEKPLDEFLGLAGAQPGQEGDFTLDSSRQYYFALRCNRPVRVRYQGPKMYVKRPLGAASPFTPKSIGSPST